MTAQEKQERFGVAFAALSGFNRRRAYIATRYAFTKERYTAEPGSYTELERHRQELSEVDEQAIFRYATLRELQTRYLVEYEVEEKNFITSRLQDKKYSEELFLFNDHYIDTYSNGWDMEDAATQDLVYEVADFLTQYKSVHHLITNIKRL